MADASLRRKPLVSHELFAGLIYDASIEVDETRDAYKAATKKRNDLIVNAHESGAISITKIAKVAGLTYKRVNQIIGTWTVDPHRARPLGQTGGEVDAEPVTL